MKDYEGICCVLSELLLSGVVINQSEGLSFSECNTEGFDSLYKEYGEEPFDSGCGFVSDYIGFIVGYLPRNKHLYYIYSKCREEESWGIGKAKAKQVRKESSDFCKNAVVIERVS